LKGIARDIGQSVSIEVSWGVMESYKYNAFGVIFMRTESTTIDSYFLFAGRDFDSETGFCIGKECHDTYKYNGENGCWNREDPAGYVDGLNLYGAYFDVNGVDATGLSCEKCEHVGSVLSSYTCPYCLRWFPALGQLIKELSELIV
jgi:RHS repeat-associated protein